MRALILALCLLPAAAIAADPPIAAERRFLPVDEAEDWSGVGRLNARGGFCTGALIAPDTVLTAAHCIYDRLTGQAIPVGEMRFVAGSRSGYHTAHRRVTRAAAHPDWSGFEGAKVRVAGDIAVVTLESPLSRIEGRTYETGPAPGPGDDVALLSYGADRETALSIQEPCQVVERFSRSAALNCDVTYGASGSPIFADGRIVGVVSAMVGTGANKIALAVLVDQAIEALVGPAQPDAKPEPAPSGGLAARFRGAPAKGSRLPGGKRPPSQ